MNSNISFLFSRYLQLLALLIICFCLFLVDGWSIREECKHDDHTTIVTLIKIGGSVLTDKAAKETLNTTTLDWFVQTLSEVVSTEAKQRFIVIHGAGSFGHFQAKEYGLKSVTQSIKDADDDGGGNISNHTRMGVAKTRMSVQTLNRLVVERLVEKGDLPAVGVSPGFSGVLPSGCLQDDVEDDFDGNWSSLFQDVLQPTVEAGFIPVLHGDACLYNNGKNVGILSGDILMSAIGRHVDRVIFLTDVAGIFTADPRINSDAKLLPHVQVNSEGKVVTELQATGSTHEHDVTGGLESKLGSAATIAARGTSVWMVQGGTQSAEKVLMGLEENDGSREDHQIVATRVTRRPE